MLKLIPRQSVPAEHLAAAAPAPRPTKSVQFLIPSKPQPRKSIQEVRDRNYVWKGKKDDSSAEFDLAVFAWTDGKCPHCKGRPSNQHKLNTWVKIIHTLDEPRFVQGIGMNCEACGMSWQTYEKGYVDTLPSHRQKELNAIIVGASDGIDMGLVRLLRSGMSARGVEKTCIANLAIWHKQMKDLWKVCCNTSIANGY